MKSSIYLNRHVFVMSEYSFGFLHMVDYSISSVLYLPGSRFVTANKKKS